LAISNASAYSTGYRDNTTYSTAPSAEPAPEETVDTDATAAALSETAQFAAIQRSPAFSAPVPEESHSYFEPSSNSNETETQSEEAENVPNSVVESLRRSGIWKDSEPNSTDDSNSTTASEDPRDVVGAAFQADSSPLSGIDPGKHPAEQLRTNPWAGAHPSSDEHEEESIDAYMERLMQRVSGGTGEVTGAMAVAEHLQRAKAQVTKKIKTAPADLDDAEFEYTPKVAAPEKSADLNALRELAMTSANVHIQNYHAATKAKTANEKWIVVVVAMICALGLCYICVNYKSDWSYLAAGAAFMVALYWAIQASFSTVAAKKLTQKEKFSASSDEKTASKVDVNLLRADKKSVKLHDEPSAGVTFQELVAERERMNAAGSASAPQAPKELN
jgi:hypothetical protein